MQNSKLIVMDIDIEERITNIVNEYIVLALEDAINPISLMEK